MENRETTEPIDRDAICDFKIKVELYRRIQKGTSFDGVSPEKLTCLDCEGTVAYATNKGYDCHTKMQGV